MNWSVHFSYPLHTFTCTSTQFTYMYVNWIQVRISLTPQNFACTSTQFKYIYMNWVHVCISSTHCKILHVCELSLSKCTWTQFTWTEEKYTLLISLQILHVLELSLSTFSWTAFKYALPWSLQNFTCTRT